MTSESLLREFPALDQSAGWETFRAEFDQRECVANRAKAKVVHEGAEPSPEISELRHLCHSIETYDFFSGPDLLMVPPHTFADYEAKVQWLVKVSSSLADKVGILLSVSSAGDQLRELVQSEVRRQQLRALPKGVKETRMGHEALLAFIGFIQRENRLPSKKELNLEAGRRSQKLKRLTYSSPLSHGQRFTADGRRWRVQSCRENYRFPVVFWGEEPPTFSIELIDCSSGDLPWIDSRWRIDTFSKEVVKPFGFKGLPRHRNG